MLEFIWQMLVFDMLNFPLRFEDVAVVVDGRIPTKTFLDACSAIVPVFGRFALAFVPAPSINR